MKVPIHSNKILFSSKLEMLLSSAFLIDLKINHNKRDYSQFSCFKNKNSLKGEREGRAYSSHGRRGSRREEALSLRSVYITVMVTGCQFENFETLGEKREILDFQIVE